MEYTGMIQDGLLYIPSLNESRNVIHKPTVVCSQYVFEMDEF